MVEGLHRYCKQGLVRVLDRRFHILVVAEGAVRDYDPLGVEGTLKARLELVQPALEKEAELSVVTEDRKGKRKVTFRNRSPPAPTVHEESHLNAKMI